MMTAEQRKAILTCFPRGSLAQNAFRSGLNGALEAMTGDVPGRPGSVEEATNVAIAGVQSRYPDFLEPDVNRGELARLYREAHDAEQAHIGGELRMGVDAPTADAGEIAATGNWVAAIDWLRGRFMQPR